MSKITDSHSVKLDEVDETTVFDSTDEELQESDEDIVEKILSHYTLIYKRIIAMSQDHHLAEDITQKTMIKAIADPKRMQKYSDLSAALSTTAKNELKMYYRKQRLIPVSDILEYIDMPENEKINVYERLAFDEFQILYEAINSLPEAQAQVLILHNCNRMTFKEIGEFLNINANTAASRHRAALMNLRKYYGLDPETGKPPKGKKMNTSFFFLMV